MQRRRSDRYGFVKPGLVRLFTVVDGVGGVLARPFRHRGAWPEPRRILLVNMAHIGDVLLTTAAIRAVRQRYPGAHLTALAGPWGADVLKYNPRLDAVITSTASWWDRARGAPYVIPREYAAFVTQLRRGAYDCVLNFKSFLQENLACALAGVPRRIGYGIYGGGFLQTDLLDFPWASHTIEQHLVLARALGADVPDPSPEIFWSAEDEAAAEAAHGALPTSRFAALHVGAGAPAKMWPPEHFARAADLLYERHAMSAVFVGGSSDLESIARVRQRMSAPSAVLAGALSINRTAAMLRRAAIFVGNDSGPAHIAAAVGIPTVAVFSGVNDASIWRPWGKRVVVLQRRPDCYLCGLNVCDRDHVCVTAITPEQVVAAAQALLEVAA